ncbi:MAG: DUF4450 domain-containing protein [Prevotellaceae bacterium]|nr:DUF4450 domain-containing protein [Prevotellaceae bacterium]
MSLSLALLMAVLSAQGAPFGRALSGSREQPRVASCDHPEFALLLPHMSGNLKLGIISDNRSAWLNNPQNIKAASTKNGVSYEVTDPLLGKGTLTLRARALNATDGLLVEAEALGVPEGVKLLWAYGGACGKVIDAEPALAPEYCRNNVFSVEGGAFTLYFGEVMRLKIVQGLTPPESEICLSDARQQSSPLAFFQSGKKTDAPALTGALPLLNGQKYYFCVYVQSAKADYAYYMLPQL